MISGVDNRGGSDRGFIRFRSTQVKVGVTQDSFSALNVNKSLKRKVDGKQHYHRLKTAAFKDFNDIITR